MTLVAIDLGFREAPTETDRDEIAFIACLAVAYNCGFQVTPKGKQMAVWVRLYQEMRCEGGNWNDLLSDEQLGDMAHEEW